MCKKLVYLMRGLPSCGKSHTARRLAGRAGVVCETDEYFYTQFGDDHAQFDWRGELLPEAREWNFARFQEAVRRGVGLVVVDRGNGLNAETHRYVRCALEHGYRVELKEPESEWWREIRILLKYKKYTRPVLEAWAEQLARLSRETHRVPVDLIRRQMKSWHWDLTVQEILAYEDQPQLAGLAAVNVVVGWRESP